MESWKGSWSYSGGWFSSSEESPAGRRDIGSFSFEVEFMGWTEVLVARILVVTEGVLWLEAVEPDLTV